MTARKKFVFFAFSILFPSLAVAECPGTVLLGDHTSFENSVYTMTIVNGGPAILSQRKVGNLLVKGWGKLSCSGTAPGATVNVVMFSMKSASPGPVVPELYGCNGVLVADGRKTNEMECRDLSGNLLGHIASGAVFYTPRATGVLDVLPEFIDAD